MICYPVRQRDPPPGLSGISAFQPGGMFLEPTIGIEPMNLFLTKEALYRLSYVGVIFRFLWLIATRWLL